VRKGARGSDFRVNVPYALNLLIPSRPLPSLLLYSHITQQTHLHSHSHSHIRAQYAPHCSALHHTTSIPTLSLSTLSLSLFSPPSHTHTYSLPPSLLPHTTTTTTTTPTPTPTNYSSFSPSTSSSLLAFNTFCHFHRKKSLFFLSEKVSNFRLPNFTPGS
jgi:hypothetical protein